MYLYGNGEISSTHPVLFQRSVVQRPYSVGFDGQGGTKLDMARVGDISRFYSLLFPFFIPPFFSSVIHFLIQPFFSSFSSFILSPLSSLQKIFFFLHTRFKEIKKPVHVNNASCFLLSRLWDTKISKSTQLQNHPGYNISTP